MKNSIKMDIISNLWGLYKNKILSESKNNMISISFNLLLCIDQTLDDNEKLWSISQNI